MAIFRMMNAFLMGILVTTGLFSFMRVITDAPGEQVVVVDTFKLPSVHLVESLTIEKLRPPKAQIKKPDPQLFVESIDVVENDGARPSLDLTNLAKGIGRTLVHSKDETNGTRRAAFHPGLDDRDPFPLLRVDPQYPPQAQQKRLEGWVHVRFTISTAGSVEDAAVVESSHPVFERSALQAVAKWKYQPSLRAGKPVETPDQQVVLRFQQPER